MTAAEELALVQAAIGAIEAIITTVKNAKAGTVNPATATAAITALQSSLAANDAAANAALAAKFPGQ